MNSLLTLLVHNLALFSCAIYCHLKLNVRVVLTIILIPPFSTDFVYQVHSLHWDVKPDNLSWTLAYVALKSMSSIPTVSSY